MPIGLIKVKSHKRADGTKVRSHVRQVGQQHSYHIRVSAKERHQDLKLAEKKSLSKILTKLRKLAVLTRKSQPKNSKVYNTDLHWLQRHK
jgi:hypothetical protein